jgi:hypothetical protein
MLIEAAPLREKKVEDFVTDWQLLGALHLR